MDKLLVNLGIKYLAAKLDGKKTYFGGVVMMLIGTSKVITAAVGFIGTLYPDIATPMDPQNCLDLFLAGVGAFGAGLAAFGIGHKIEKSTPQGA